MVENDNLSTKERILHTAVALFAEKGFTETTIRELAAAVGMNAASIYYHFPSKSSILDSILEDYVNNIANTFQQDRFDKLKGNITAEGILSCLELVFPADKAAYYLNVLRVMLQEQYRNAQVRKILTDYIILGGEQVIKKMIRQLIDNHVLAENTDADFWVKAHSSFVYTFSCRMALGIGDQSSAYTGMDLTELLGFMYDLLLKTCKVDAGSATQSEY
ncbi:MAG: TetR/AcrR family transcriptional regulator [Clostridiales bacterium]|nr:TetR/AcrR family transcriptional regulator [Clostridiales bacterium]